MSQWSCPDQYVMRPSVGRPPYRCTMTGNFGKIRWYKGLASDTTTRRSIMNVGIRNIPPAESRRRVLQGHC